MRASPRGDNLPTPMPAPQPEPPVRNWGHKHRPADVAELADALDSGSSARKGVEVQVLSSALDFTGFQRIIRLSPFFVGSQTRPAWRTHLVDLPLARPAADASRRRGEGRLRIRSPREVQCLPVCPAAWRLARNSRQQDQDGGRLGKAYEAVGRSPSGRHPYDATIESNANGLQRQNSFDFRQCCTPLLGITGMARVVEQRHFLIDFPLFTVCSLLVSGKALAGRLHA